VGRGDGDGEALLCSENTLSKHSSIVWDAIVLLKDQIHHMLVYDGRVDIPPHGASDKCPANLSVLQPPL